SGDAAAAGLPAGRALARHALAAAEGAAGGGGADARPDDRARALGPAQPARARAGGGGRGQARDDAVGADPPPARARRGPLRLVRPLPRPPAAALPAGDGKAGVRLRRAEPRERRARGRVPPRGARPAPPAARGGT